MDNRVSGKPIAVALAVLLALAGLYKWWPSDERAIRRQLDALADTLTVPSTDTDLSRITRLTEFRNYLAPDVHIRMGRLDLTPRDAVMGAAEQWRPPPGGVYVAWANGLIEVMGDRARVSLTLKVTTADPSGGDPVVDERDIRLVMVKQDGDWLVMDVEAADASGKGRL